MKPAEIQVCPTCRRAWIPLGEVTRECNLCRAGIGMSALVGGRGAGPGEAGAEAGRAAAAGAGADPMRHPRRHASRRKLVRLFLRGWSFRLLARWYALPVLLVEDVVRLGTRRAGA